MTDICRSPLTLKLSAFVALSEAVSQASIERLSVLEQAAPLADEFARTCDDIDQWLEQIEIELENCPAVLPGLTGDMLKMQKEHNKVCPLFPRSFHQLCS